MLTVDFVFGLLGILGGLLCAVGDILFDLKGKGNSKSGPSGLIDSNWQKMADWRFPASILLAGVGVPLYLLGFLGMSNQLAQTNETVGMIFLVFAVVGSAGGFFIHAIVCCIPVICKTLGKKNVGEDTIHEVVGKLFSAIKIPFVVMFCSLVMATSITLIFAILKGYLHVPLIFIVVNPLGLMLIGWVFRLINKKVFSDLPGIIMPSMGIAMIGLMTAISASR